MSTSGSDYVLHNKTNKIMTFFISKLFSKREFQNFILGISKFNGFSFLFKENCL